MKLRVNEIFCSLQGEGHYTGTAAVFLRLAGCNLKCDYCDTQHDPYREMTVQQVLQEVCQYTTRHLVITGGEPSLQVTPELTVALHREGFYIQMETNGTLPLKEGVEIDWITCSPKKKEIALTHIDELKVLCFGGDEGSIEARLAPYLCIPAQEYRLQPLDTSNEERNRVIQRETIEYIIHHTQWKLSLQTHKILNVR